MEQKSINQLTFDLNGCEAATCSQAVESLLEAAPEFQVLGLCACEHPSSACAALALQDATRVPRVTWVGEN